MRPVLLLVACFAPAPFLPPQKGPGDDLTRLQGDWVYLARKTDGAPISHIVATVRITGDRLTYINASGSWKRAWTLELDAKKSPREYSSRYTGSEETVHGVYKLEGDTLTLSFTHKGKHPRPMSFSGLGPGVSLEVLKRKKP